MKKLYVYADFDWLKEVELIGELGYESLRGADSYSFTFNNEWLRQHSNLFLSDDLNNYPGQQYTQPDKDIFGCFSDALPDRWGRTLLLRREQIAAAEEKRPVRRLSSFAEGQHASSLLDPLLHPVSVAHVSAVDTHKRRQDDPRKYSHQQHDNRVISLYAKPCIPSGRTQCKKTGEITTPAHCHIADHQDFRQEKAHAFSLCAIAELPCPHDDH